MPLAIWIVLIVIVVLALIAISVAVGRAVLARQRRIWQMKRFRRATRGGRVEFDEQDKKTISV